MVWKVMQDEGPLLDRYHNAEVWVLCEKAMGIKVPVYMNRAHFPSERVKAATAELERSKNIRAGERG